MITHSKNIERTELVEKINAAGIRYMARVGTRLCDANGAVRDIIGFSFTKDRETSLNLATYEMYERFWAVYPLACGVVTHEIMDCSRYYSNTLQRVIIGDLLPSFGKHTSNIDSTGFAYGNSFNQAVEHGLLEVCERHLLEKSWYSHEPLIQISSIKITELFSTLHSYILKNSPIPFVMSILVSEDHSFLTAGSSVHQTFSRAQAKAEEEALMIGVSRKKGLTPTYTKSEHIDKYKKTTAKTIKKQIEHINKKTQNATHLYKNFEHTWSAKKIATITFGKNVDPLVCIIHTEPKEVIVRVSIENTKTPRDSRGSVNFPIDPFN